MQCIDQSGVHHYNSGQARKAAMGGDGAPYKVDGQKSARDSLKLHRNKVNNNKGGGQAGYSSAEDSQGRNNYMDQHLEWLMNET